MKQKNKFLLTFLSLLVLSGCSSANHTHTYSSKWSANELYHFHEDTCGHGTKSDYEEHSYVNGFCSVCGASEPKKHEHSYSVWNVETEPTLTTKGKISRTCLECQNKEVNDLPALNKKDYDFSIISEATCVEKEVDRYIININGQQFTFDIETNFANHVYTGQYEVLKEPTTSETGSLVRYCDVCNNSEELALPILSKDNYEYEVLEEGSCIKKEKAKYTIEVNGQTFSFEGDGEFGEHTFNDGSCSVCGESEGTQGLDYTLSDDGTYYKVSGIGSAEGTKDIIIPDKYKGLPVSEIGSYAFGGYKTYINSIKLPNSIKKIGSQAFDGCTGLKEINISESVTEIGNNAFLKCSSLKEIVIPQSVIELGDAAFSGCSSLKEIKIPGNVKKINRMCFENCVNLESITIANGVEYLDYALFYGCSKLTSLYIPSSVKTIGYPIVVYGLTSGCSNLTSLMVDTENQYFYSYANCIIQKSNKVLIAGCNSSIIPSDVIEIGNGAFYGMEKIESVTIPANITNIGFCAFGDCINLSSVDISNGVKSIEGEAFGGNNKISYISIPSSVTSISSRTFGRDIKNVDLGSSNSKYYNIGNAIIERDTKTLIAGFNNTVIMNDIVAIGESAFMGCSFKTIAIPNNIMEIGDSAFSHCDNLETIELPDTITKIGMSIFDMSEKLSSVKLPNTISEVTGQMFYNCESLKSIKMPDSIKKILMNAFAQCTGLETISFSNNLKEIGDYAFRMCINLKSIVLPDGLTTIGSYAFSSCSSLESVVFPTSVTSLGERVFNYDNKLTIFYLGTYSDWISKFNDKIELSKLSYYSETKPTDSNYSYWHYVNNVPTKW